MPPWLELVSIVGISLLLYTAGAVAAVRHTRKRDRVPDTPAAAPPPDDPPHRVLEV